jgi:hypothetical protein
VKDRFLRNLRWAIWIDRHGLVPEEEIAAEGVRIAAILKARGAAPLPRGAGKRLPRHRAMRAFHRIEDMVRAGKL